MQTQQQTIEPTKKIGIGRLIEAWTIATGLIVITIFCAVRLSLNWGIASVIILAILIYFRNGTVRGSAKRIQAFTVFGEMVMDRQLGSEVSFLYPIIENTSIAYGQEEIQIPVEIKIEGITSDGWSVSATGQIMYMPVSAPLMYAVGDKPRVVIDMNLKSLAQQSSLSRFAQYTAQYIETGKHEVIKQIRNLIENAIEAEVSIGDSLSTMARYGIDIQDVLLNDPVIDPEFYKVLKKESMETYIGKGENAKAKAIVKSAKILKKSGVDSEEALLIVQRGQGLVKTEETVFTINDPDNVIHSAAETIGTVIKGSTIAAESIARVVEKNVRKRFSSRKNKNAKK